MLANCANFCDSRGMEQSLDEEVRTLLEQRRGEWMSIAKELDISHSWISQFVRRKIPDSGYQRLRRLHEHLKGCAAASKAAA